MPVFPRSATGLPTSLSTSPRCCWSTAPPYPTPTAPSSFHRCPASTIAASLPFPSTSTSSRGWPPGITSYATADLSQPPHHVSLASVAHKNPKPRFPTAYPFLLLGYHLSEHSTPSSAGPAAAIFPIFPLQGTRGLSSFHNSQWFSFEFHATTPHIELLVITNLTTTMSAIEIDRRTAAALQSFCGLSFMIASYVMTNLYSLNLITHTTETLRLILIIQGPIVVFVYSFLRRDHQQSSYWWAVVRGLSALPVGALVNAFGAIVLGAPVGIRYLPNTIYWSLLMSLFTFVPPVCVFGSSRADWHHILAHFRQDEPLNALVSLPAYGSVVGAWLGAWPMPLDWERPWQEWPICVSYGAAAGYLVGLLTSSVLVLVQGRARVKKD